MKERESGGKSVYCGEIDLEIMIGIDLTGSLGLYIYI